MRKNFKIFTAALLCSLLSSSAVSTARADDLVRQDLRTIAKDGGYGLLAGTAVGLAVLPFTASSRGVFIGSSLGLYMGVIVSLFTLTSRPTGSHAGTEGAPAEAFLVDPFSAVPQKVAAQAPVSFSIEVKTF